jgi:hypothetical protein
VVSTGAIRTPAGGKAFVSQVLPRAVPGFGGEKILGAARENAGDSGEGHSHRGAKGNRMAGGRQSGGARIAGAKDVSAVANKKTRVGVAPPWKNREFCAGVVR